MAIVLCEPAVAIRASRRREATLAVLMVRLRDRYVGESFKDSGPVDSLTLSKPAEAAVACGFCWAYNFPAGSCTLSAPR